MKMMKKRLLALFLTAVMVLGMLPANAFAAEADSTGGTEPAADAVVYVSGAKNGTLFLANQPVTVKDLNEDGQLSYDEAMKAAHDAYCPGGYVSIEGSYGLQVGKVWGEGNGTFANALFYNNDTALQMNVGQSYVNPGDRLYACSLKYSDSWNDVYTKFDKTELTVTAGEEFTLTLDGSSYMGSALSFEGLQVGTWSNDSFTALAGKTFNANGQVTLSFAEAGTYLVSAEGEYYDDYENLTPIMPPYCEVTVTAANVAVEEITLDKANTEITVGGDTLTLTATVTPDNATDKTVTWTSSDESVATVADGVVTAVSAGTVTITAKAGEKTAVCTVTVNAAAPVQSGKLSALQFASDSAATGTPYTMQPAFDPAVKEYTLVVPDSTSSVYAKVTLADDVTGTITANYTKTTGTASSVTLTSGKSTGTSLSNAVAAGKLDGNTIEIKVGGETAYTIKLVRQATLSKLAVTTADGSKVSLSPTFSATKTEYTADVPYDAVLTVAATVKSTGAVVTVNGDTATSITPVWANRGSNLVVTASGGEETVDGVYTIHLAQLATAIEIQTPPTKTDYAAGEKFDPSGMTLKAVYNDGFTETIDSTGYTYSPTGPLSQSVKAIAVSFDGLTVEQPITVPAVFEGSGTQESPYLIKTTEDLVQLSNLVASGISFSGEYFKMVNPITLPDAEGDDAWVPIGTSKTAPFSGYFDGNGQLLTVPEDGLSLIGFPVGATLYNLDIKGTKIAGFGVVNNYAVGASITIEKVTLKSGTQTLKAGFIGGYASGSNAITIKDCTVESGVVIGYDKQQKWIGSFGGEFNGTIDNCVSYADVYGTDFVGGIVSDKGQTMGTFVVKNCKFYGTVTATGNYVGGIVGHGYGGTGWGTASAPNTPCVTIQNCTATGNITGANYVGGILGAESGVVQCWNNGIGYIQNNSFTGTVTATNGTYVGGIIGYMNSLDRYNVIENNYYALSCNASKGIGFVKYVDTSCETHEAESGATYFNTAEGKPGISGVSRTDHNRTDDPLGADATKLCYTDTDVDPVAVELKISGDYKTEYTAGDELDLTGIKLTVNYNWGDPKIITLDDVTITGFDTEKLGEQELTVTYGSLMATITVTVKAPENEKVTVTLSVLGDTLHGENEIHTLADGNLLPWVEAASYTVDAGSTVWDLLQTVFEKNDITCDIDSSNDYGTVYIKSLTYNGTTIGEFDNGDKSGWMYTINGEHPEVGVSAKIMTDGDVIVLHYTDDYSKEDADSKTIDVNVTISNAGDVVMAQEAVTVSDLNGDGKFDVDETLYAAHEAGYTGGAAEGYESYAGDYGLAISKLWGDESGMFGYWLNNASCWSLADEVKEGDYLVAFIYQNSDWSDKYAKFDSFTYTAGSELTVTLEKSGYDDNWNTVFSALKGATITVCDAGGNELDTEKYTVKDNGDGTYTITFTESGKYVLIASEETTPIVPAVSRVSVAIKSVDSDTENIYKVTGDYVEGLGTPGVGSIGGEWMVIGLERSGRETPNAEDYYAAVVRYIRKNINGNEQLHRAKSTENSRIILALTAMGYDVTNVDGHNLLKGLTNLTYLKKQGINGPIWALIAFDSHDYEIPEGNVTREVLIQTILDAQLADGGWTLSGSEADVDVTAMAVQALAPYYSTNGTVKAAIDKALAMLSAVQNADGSFGSVDGSCTESCAQVIVALTSLGINPETDARFVKNGYSVVDALCSFYVNGGGFVHIAGGERDGMATEQGYYALAAYYRFLNSQTSLYDMSDVAVNTNKPGNVPAEEPKDNDSKDNESSGSTKKDGNTADTPKTGDESNAGLYAGMLSISALALAVLLIAEKKRKFTGKNCK